MEKNVRIAVRDPHDKYSIAFLDNSVEGAIHFDQADLTRYFAGNATIFELRHLKKHVDANLIREGCKLAFVYREKSYWLNIISTADSGMFRTLVAVSLTLEAQNENVLAFAADRAMSFEEYLTRFDFEKSLEIGTNEVSDKKLKLDWEGSQKILARIFSLGNKFDAEIEFVTEINRDYSLKRNVINVYRKNDGVYHGMGQNTGVTLRVGEELDVIDRKTSIEPLYTGIRATGKDGISVVGVTIDERDENGNKILWSPKESNTIYAPAARDQFPSVTNHKSDGYIVEDKGETEYSTVEALKGYMISELKKHWQPEMDYEVAGYFSSNPGDTFRLVDGIHYNPPLYLEARVSEQTESLVDPKRNKTTFSNFVLKQSELSKSLLDQMQEMIDANKKFDCLIMTDKGVQFVDGKGETTLTASVRDGIIDVTATYNIIWAKDGVEFKTAPTLKVKASEIDEKSVFSFRAVDADGKERGRAEVTITNVNNGKTGAAGRGIVKTERTYAKSASDTVIPTTWQEVRPSVPGGEFLWIKETVTYTDNSKDDFYTPHLMGRTGDSGLGIKDKKVEYAKGPSGTQAPTTGWSTNIPTVNADEFFWTRTVLTYTDNSVTTSYNVGGKGANGKDAQLLYLTATSETMIFNSDDTPKIDQTITVSAKTQNTAGTATFKAIPYIGNTAQAAITLGGSGNDRTLSTSQWTNKNWTLIAITATLGSLSDTLSIVKVKDGSQGIPGEPGPDGKTPYTHYAYAWSADGKDRFTTTNPGENYWTPTNPQFIKPNWVYGPESKSFIYNTTNTSVALFYTNSVLREQFPDDDGVGKVFTISFDVETTQTDLQFANNRFYINQDLNVTHNQPTLVVGKKVRVYGSFTYKKATAGTTLCHIYFKSNNNQVTNLTISGVKIEQGDNLDPIHTPSPTDDPLGAVIKYRGTASTFDPNPPSNADLYEWTLNPDWVDMSAKLGLDEKVDNDSYNENQVQVWEEIGNRVTAAEAEEIRELAQKVSDSYHAFVDPNGTYQSDLEALESRTVAIVEDLADKVARWNFIDTYMSIGEEGLVIGSKSSSMKVIVSNGRVGFSDGGKEVAYFTNQSFFINQGAIVDSLQVGQHKIVKLNADHTIIQWVRA